MSIIPFLDSSCGLSRTATIGHVLEPRGRRILTLPRGSFGIVGIRHCASGARQPLTAAAGRLPAGLWVGWSAAAPRPRRGHCPGEVSHGTVSCSLNGG